MSRFYTFYFTFHDLFAPLCLMSLSCYISLKFTGVTAEMKWKRQVCTTYLLSTHYLLTIYSLSTHSLPSAQVTDDL